jgi:hypothetical protein
MLPAVLGVWLDVLVEGDWLELALLEVCGVELLVALDGYCELEAVPLMFPLVPAFELEVLGVCSVVLEVEEVVVVCSLELDGVVLEEEEELGYELEACGLLLLDELVDGFVVALELELDGLMLLVEVVVPDGLVAEALVPVLETVILSFTLVTPGTDFATSFAFLRSALEATVPSRCTTPFCTLT